MKDSKIDSFFSLTEVERLALIRLCRKIVGKEFANAINDHYRHHKEKPCVLYGLLTKITSKLSLLEVD